MDNEYYIEVRTNAYGLLNNKRHMAYGSYIDRIDESFNAGFALIRTIPLSYDEYMDLLEELYDTYGERDVVEVPA